MNKEIDLDETIEVEEAGLLRKNLSGIIDAAVIMAVFIGLVSLVPVSVLSSLEETVPSELYILLLLAIYRLISLLIFNSTIGMQVCRIQILTHELESLSFKEKVSVSFFILINGVGYYRSA